MGPSQLWVTPITNSFLPTNELPTWNVDLSTLQSEKEILEDGLANCVTYLQVLRKKQARTERRLVTDPSLPRKKRKRFQQAKRELEKEIKHREQDEQAFLNNLQACKANIYIAETVSLPSTAISSTLPDSGSISTGCSYPRDLESAPTETSWNGWTDQSALSPFQRESISPFFSFDVAPDEHLQARSTDGTISDDYKQPLDAQHTRKINPIPSASSNTPTHLLLSPEAPIFHPQTTYTNREGSVATRLAEINLSSAMAVTTSSTVVLELLDRCLVSCAGMGLARRQGSLGNVEDDLGSLYLANSSTDATVTGGKLKYRRGSL
ncbi:hypothetical protein J4E93_002694 [Alternaria ventricosa]|uniref:uncharacterized protein n=1 Tax=Alternaria ventricosa TaxID=1187951 RepID=UPI0020C4E4AB|nr:uncharacterized protein J4E93_002694 [Alternaria ventricosa]KAI4650338.1 hypothetical protein J4E93_002694 [Alternaria ventricosa]